MLLNLDRVIVAVDDLAAAADDYTRLLGREASMNDGEGRALFRLGNTALELATREGMASPGPTPATEGVAGIVFQEDGREEATWLPGTSSRGIPIGLVSDESEDGLLPGGLSMPTTEPAASVAALDHVVISTGDLDAARALYGEELGIRLALDRQLHIARLQVTVNDMPLVRRLDGGGDLQGDPESVVGGKRPPFEPVGQRRSLDQFEDERP